MISAESYEDPVSYTDPHGASYSFVPKQILLIENLHALISRDKIAISSEVLKIHARRNQKRR